MSSHPELQSSTPPSSRILLVEDDANVGDALKAGLQQDHITLVTARDAHSALQFLHTDQFDLVLLDLGLPGTDGFGLLQTFQQDEQLRSIPVIILTARNASEDKVRGFDLGAVDYVTKPFELSELRARVRSVLKLQRLQRELIDANHTLNSARIAAEEGARGKADFLANMSHEIRTPMNGVIAMTGLLMQTELAADQRDFVETIRSSGESLITIIDDILHFSKLESRKMELERRPMDLRQCAEETLDLLASRAAEKNLDLVLQLEQGTPHQVIGDSTRIRQILINLTSNALKFTAAGSVSVHVASRPQSAASPQAPAAHEFLISVRDTGIGIPADKLDRLFQSFSQVDSSVNRQYGGTGLGLAISKGLVELMGGRLWVESTEGAGSAFHFTLPLHEAAPAKPAASSGPCPALAGKRVLVIEDGTVSRAMLVQHLTQWGMQPVITESAEQALVEVGKLPGVALAIVDCQLPGRSGAVLAAELRKFRNHHALPVLLLNTVSNQIEGLDSLSANWSAVTKPVKPAQLLGAVQQLLSGAAPQAQKKHQAASKLDADMATRLPLRILLTDDNVINQKVAVRLLQQLGYKADIANNGIEAIHAVEINGYDIILMDVQMPEVDGLEATRRIRARQQQPAPTGHFARPIAIIAMTANAMQGDREKCVAAGMDDYLPKPVRPEALQTMLEKHGTRLAQEGETSPKGTPTHPGPVASAPPELRILPSPPPVVEQPPVDMERLYDFAGGSQDNYNELVTLYLKQTTEQLALMSAALAAGNAENTSRIAHSCAGASATCGMTAIVPLLRQIEHLSQEENLQEAAKLLPGVAQEFERLQRFLETQKPFALTG